MSEETIPVRVELRDAFGSSHIVETIYLAKDEFSLLDGKVQTVPFMFPGTLNRNLRWYLVFHGEAS